MLAFVMSCFALGPAHAPSTFTFQGQTIDDDLMGAPFTGEITGTITFAPMPLVPGSELGTADAVDFSFEIGGLAFDFANSSFLIARFEVDSAENFSYYVFIAEQELVDTGPGIEQLTLSLSRGTLFESIVVGDSRPGESGAVGDGASVRQRGAPSGGFTPSAPAAPLPASGWRLVAGMTWMGLRVRRRA